MQHRWFAVSQIHCQGCQQTINGALGDVEGIHRVSPDIASNLVTVAFDPDIIGEDAISDRLSEAGFPVQQVSGGGRDRAGGGGGVDARRGVTGWYGLLVAAVLAIAVAGYAGYVLYPRFDLPAAQGAGLLGLAAAAGIASFFSPCSFPLLLGLLGRQAVSQAGDDEDPAARPVVFGGALALGAAVFMILAGAVIGLGGQALFAGVTFTSVAGIAIRSVVGVLLIGLGLMQTGWLPLSMHPVEQAARPLSRHSAKLRRERPVVGFGVFGFSYVLAGFG